MQWLLKALAFALALIIISGPLLTFAHAPDLSHLDYLTKGSIQSACSSAYIQGPASYANCINMQLESLRGSGGIPDLSHLDYLTKGSIQSACSSAYSQGPASYANCIRAQLKSIAVQPDEPKKSPSIVLPTPDTQKLKPESPPERPPVALSPPVPSKQPPSAEHPKPSQKALPKTAKPPVSTPSSWANAKKPNMPSKLNTVNLTADSIFKIIEKSVYVLVSAPSESNLHNESDLNQGSAVAISSKMALTNCHILRGNRLHFLVKDESFLKEKVSHSHTESDRCVLEVESGTLSSIARIRPYNTLSVGERVYTVGSPSGLENTLGEGIISGLRKLESIDLIQTSAPISPGSSGGGLFDAAGNLIGITTFLLRDSQNLNFAIAADAYWK